MKPTTLVLGLCVGLAAGAAAAQTAGPYVGFNAGSGVIGNTSVSASVSGVGSASTGFTPRPGFFGSGVGGYAFSNGLALEAEALYTNNHVDTTSLDTAFGAAANATVEGYGGVANVLYAITRVGRIVPYIGGGVGYGEVRYRVYGVSSTNDGLIWQVRAGLSYTVTPKVSVEIGYRYLDTPSYDRSFSGDVGGTFQTVTLKAHTVLDVFTIGARTRF